MKYLKAFLLLLVCYLPMASCLAYRAGIGADILCLTLFFAASAAVYIFSGNIPMLILYFFNLAIAVIITPRLLSDLYIGNVTGLYDQGTDILGDAASIIFLVIAIITAVVLTLLKSKNDKTDG